MLRLAKFFWTTHGFWLNIQTQYDMKTMCDVLKKDLDNIHTYMYEAAEA